MLISHNWSLSSKLVAVVTPKR
ncbi:hypothetical protein ID866_11331 [Astraeus odoratus]|nr:hypothetical protein ID866_11331 [Astraeus odoratus]